MRETLLSRTYKCTDVCATPVIIEDVKGNVVDLKLYRNKLSKLTYNIRGIPVDLTKTDRNKRYKKIKKHTSWR